MRRTHGLVVSALLGVAVVSGAYAAIATSGVGTGASQADIATGQAIRLRAKKLDAWDAALGAALSQRPPELPRVPRFAPVAMVPAPAAALPTARARAAARATAGNAGMRSGAPAAHSATARTHAADHAADEVGKKADGAASAPAPPSPGDAGQPVGSGPGSISDEDAAKQCVALEHAAEGQGERAQQEAERRCRELERDDGDEEEDDD